MNQFKGLVAGAMLAATAFSSMGAGTFVGGRTDFRDETIYFAITTRFYDGDPTNNVLCWDAQEKQIANGDPCWRGDFKGLIEKLPYIKALGFTAVWITPIVQNASGFDYHGYHAMDFSQVDLRYKSKKAWGATEDVDFKDLIKAAHDLDMKIVLDIVLQHTGNFGENTLCHLFDRHKDIRNQADIEKCLIPDNDKLGGKSYWGLPNEGTKTQYSERFKYMKNTDGQNHDDKNYWHHVANAWDWDVPSRWWGQIAGDCVDLNTENPAVVDYIISCYEEFIKLGVDGFRIDTTGHIAPLTFNSAFIPRFTALGEQYKGERKGDTPFYMFGECCARYGSVIYRDQHVLSSHYYTWKSEPELVSEWQSYTADWWANQVVREGAAPLGNMLTCEKDPGTVHNSDNVFMKNGAWHEPDYSDASGFNVIDFPMHYNFNDAGQAVRIAKEGDHYYNDASWNVVYVDSHDYSPGPNDGIRFNGGTAQWAENLSLMFTFRGIPCLYYGSEVEFQKGRTIDEGPGLALAESGRAYFGEYLKGSVDVEDFAKFSNATGNMAKTLNGDLSQHIIRLNQIRAAVPALRKGQYTFDGCQAKGGHAFKRAYKDSYALVALNGGATFTGVPAGNYVDIVTGKSYTAAANGTITVDAPATQGQVRVLVKGWTGDKVGVDGKFIYTTSPVSHGGDVHFTDPGTTEYYTKEDAIGDPEVKFNPAGGSFKSETLTVTASLNEVATSGSFQVNGGATFTLSAGQTKQITIGEGMAYGQTATVTWTATNGTESFSGSVNYKKVDPNAVTTIYVTGKNGADISGTNIHAWTAAGDLTTWPGVSLSNKVVMDGREFYSHTFDVSDPVNIIFNRNGAQTADIIGVEGDAFFEYDGGSNYEKIDVNVGPSAPVVRANPASGTSFSEPISVTLSVSPATDIFYTLNGQPASASSTKYTGPISITETTTISTYVKNEAGENRQSFTYTKVDGPIDPVEENLHTVYFYNSDNWGGVSAYCWDDNHQEGTSFSGAWPGTALTETVVLNNVHPDVNGKPIYKYSFEYDGELSNPKIIFNSVARAQTADYKFVHNGVYHHDLGNNGEPFAFFVTGIETVTKGLKLSVFSEGGKLVVEADTDCVIQAVRLDGTVRQLNLSEGVNYFELPKGFYIVAGKKVIL